MFKNYNTERMRIDSSGNLLVGTTNSTPHNLTSGGGLSVRGSINLFSIARQDNEVMIVNRTGTDGDIAKFYKDGTTVGSIGTASGDLNINGPAGHSGIRFQASSILPRYNGSDTDGTMDLGYHDGVDTHRWRNLYLSGGVYLGGTGAANKLDDFEEGSWTPTLDGSSSASGTTYTTRAGGYIKVGKMVTANFHILLSAKGTINGSLRISGLPFSGNNEPQYQTATLMSGNVAIDKDQQITGMQYAVNAFIYLMIQESDLALSQPTGTAILKDNTEISGSITYFTNS
jgi:hypothetical protein